jgi:tetratricopeptide (TPR) repeat protein
MRAEKGIDFFNKQIMTTELLAEKTPEEIWGLESEKVHKIYHLACDLYEKKNYEDASDLFLLLTTISPDRIVFWKGLGYSSQQVKDYAAAAVAYEFALDLEPKEAELYPCFLRTLCEMGHRDQALEVLKELMEHEFDDPPERLRSIRKEAETILRENSEVI